ALELSKRQNPKRPFVLVTGSLDEETAVLYMKAGADDYLLKDRPARLGTAVLSALHQAQQRVTLDYQQLVLNKVFDTAPSLIFVKDWDGKFILANRAVAEVYGTTVEQLVGKTDADFNPNRAEVEQFLAADRAVILSMQPRLIPEEPVTHPGSGTT